MSIASPVCSSRSARPIAISATTPAPRYAAQSARLRRVSAIYRTYVVPAREEITEEDMDYISHATEYAKQERQDIGGGLFDFLRDVLTMKVTGKQESEFLLRFQQFTGPVMAKGVEDTALYCYNRLSSMNEVGGDPGRDGISTAEFHAYCQKMQATHPLTMTTLSTHDTKRSEDVSARIAVLSEMPARFSAAIHRWSRMNSAFRTGRSGSAIMPDRNTEYLYYQTLIGAWPLTVERAQQYMLKAAREAKQQTAWTANNKPFEDALDQVHRGHACASALPARPGTVRRQGKRCGPREFSGADAAEIHGAGRAGHLSGNGAMGPEPGRSRQPQAGGLRVTPPLARRTEEDAWP